MKQINLDSNRQGRHIAKNNKEIYIMNKTYIQT